MPNFRRNTQTKYGTTGLYTCKYIYILINRISVRAVSKFENLTTALFKSLAAS